MVSYQTVTQSGTSVSMPGGLQQHTAICSPTSNSEDLQNGLFSITIFSNVQQLYILILCGIFIYISYFLLTYPMHAGRCGIFLFENVALKMFKMEDIVSIILLFDISKCFNKLENFGFFAALCSFGHFEVAHQMFGDYFSPGVLGGEPASGGFQS